MRAPLLREPPLAAAAPLGPPHVDERSRVDLGPALRWAPERAPLPRVRLDWCFAATLWRLLSRIRALAALWLLALSIAEALTVSAGASRARAARGGIAAAKPRRRRAVGKVTARFYAIYIRRDSEAFGEAVLQAVALYAALIALSSAAFLLGRLLAVRWRRRLAAAMHARYFHGDAFLRLAAPSAPDNPDQRMTEDVDRFCLALQALLRSVARTPFDLVQYAWLTCALFRSALPFAVAAGTFAVGAAAHRTVAAWLAARICAQEALEGELRAAHMRVRSAALPIAALCAAAAERAAVDACLERALRNQRALARVAALQCALQQVC